MNIFCPTVTVPLATVDSYAFAAYITELILYDCYIKARGSLHKTNAICYVTVFRMGLEREAFVSEYKSEYSSILARYAVCQ